jgi:DNA-binding transcriptional LysR family regulator
MILPGPGSLLRSKVDQVLRDHGTSFDVILSIDETESTKRYVEIGMGVAICNDFALHPEDHDRLGVVRLDHIFPGSDIGICTLRGKFLGQAVRSFIETMTNQLRGFHAELWDRSLRPGTAATPATVDSTDR